MKTNTTSHQQSLQSFDFVPVDFLWMKLKYDAYVHKAICNGLSDCKNGRVVAVSDLRETFGMEGL